MRTCVASDAANAGWVGLCRRAPGARQAQLSRGNSAVSARGRPHRGRRLGADRREAARPENAQCSAAVPRSHSVASKAGRPATITLASGSCHPEVSGKRPPHCRDMPTAAILDQEKTSTKQEYENLER